MKVTTVLPSKAGVGRSPTPAPASEGIEWIRPVVASIEELMRDGLPYAMAAHAAIAYELSLRRRREVLVVPAGALPGGGNVNIQDVDEAFAKKAARKQIVALRGRTDLTEKERELILEAAMAFNAATIRLAMGMLLTGTDFSLLGKCLKEGMNIAGEFLEEAITHINSSEEN